MRFNKRVIESTVVAGMLVVVTAVTAVSSPVAEKSLEVQVDNNGIAGITSELAAMQTSTDQVEKVEAVSVQKSVAVMVAEAGDIIEEAEAEAEETEVEIATEEAEPELTPEEQEWSSKLMADVDGALNVRVQPDENAELAGKLHRGDRADIIEQLDGWTHVVSGNVEGYVKTDYCVVGTDAMDFAIEECGMKATVLTTGLRVRQSPSEESEVYAQTAEGDKLEVKTDAENVEGWVTVNYNGNTAYVKAEYVEVEIGYGAGITIEEEQEMIRKAAEEEAAKKAAQQRKAAVSQNAAVVASVDDVTIVGAMVQHEAGYECYEGQVAVGAVVMNRVRSGAFPSSVSGVIYQSGQFTTASQLAPTIANGVNGSCIQAAQQALSGYDNTGGALYFRNIRSGIAGYVIGNHVFF